VEHLVGAVGTSTWFVRESIRGVALQRWRYGYYKAVTLKLHPRSLRLRQTAPPALVLALVTGLLQRSRAGVVLAVAYALSAGMLGAMAARSDGASPWRGATIPPIVHLAWGAGLLVGLVREPVASTRQGTVVPAEHQAERLDVIRIVMRFWALILVCCGIGAVLFGAVTWLRPDSYSSEASLVYQSAGQRIPGLGDSTGSSDPTRVLSTQAEVVVGDQVLERARVATELDVDELHERVSVEVDPDSDVMRLTGLGATATEAQQVANAVATAYIDQNREQGLEATNSQIEAL
jgi:hypothetical protein